MENLGEQNNQQSGEQTAGQQPVEQQLTEQPTEQPSPVRPEYVDPYKLLADKKREMSEAQDAGSLLGAYLEAKKIRGANMADLQGIMSESYLRLGDVPNATVFATLEAQTRNAQMQAESVQTFGAIVSEFRNIGSRLQEVGDKNNLAAGRMDNAAQAMLDAAVRIGNSQQRY